MHATICFGTPADNTSRTSLTNPARAQTPLSYDAAQASRGDILGAK